MKRFLLVPSIAALILLASQIGNAFTSNSIAVPEPATMLLFGCGPIAFVMVTRRKQRK